MSKPNPFTREYKGTIYRHSNGLLIDAASKTKSRTVRLDFFRGLKPELLVYDKMGKPILKLDLRNRKSAYLTFKDLTGKDMRPYARRKSGLCSCRGRGFIEITDEKFSYSPNYIICSKCGKKIK